MAGCTTSGPPWNGQWTISRRRARRGRRARERLLRDLAWLGFGGWPTR